MITRRELLQSGTALGGAMFAPGGSTIELCLQTRGEDGKPSITAESVDPRKIGIITVDAWHYHWCRTWRNRAASLIPPFNYSFRGARKLGMTLVFIRTNPMRDFKTGAW